MLKRLFKGFCKKLGLYTKKEAAELADAAVSTALQEKRWEIESSCALEIRRLRHERELIAEDMCALKDFALKVGVPVSSYHEMH